MEDTLMYFIIIIAALAGVALLIIFIRRKLFDNKPIEEPDNVDLLGNPISHAAPGREHDPSEKTIPIYGLSSLGEADALKALLEENGIDCMVQSFHDYAYDGLWQSQKGWGVLKVLEKDKPKAEELIADFLKTRNQFSEPLSEEPNQATPAPADKPILPGMIFAVSLFILIGIVVVILISIYAAYREFGWKAADEGYYSQLNNEHDKAIEFYDKAISRGCKEAFVYHNRGLAKFNKGDYEGAISDYTKVIAIEPYADDAYTGRGDSKYKKGDYDGAIIDWGKAIKLSPSRVKELSESINKAKLAKENK
jgi:tetratricopeptide (TPR) repeat protein